MNIRNLCRIQVQKIFVCPDKLICPADNTEKLKATGSQGIPFRSHKSSAVPAIPGFCPSHGGRYSKNKVEDVIK